MDDEKFITLVENNDVLYNKFNKDYKIPDKKRAVWSKISKEMGMPEKLCSKRWSALRDRYAKEKKSERLASGSGAAFKHRWHFMQQLEFLAPHVVSRPVRSTVNIFDEIYPVSAKKYEDVQYSALEYCEHSQTSSSLFTEMQLVHTQFTTAESQEPLLVSPIASPEQPQQKKKRKRTEQSDDSDQMFVDAVEMFKNFCKSKEDKQKQNENDANYAFCKMILATLNSFDENKQTRAIKQITDVLTQLKLEPKLNILFL